MNLDKLRNAEQAIARETLQQLWEMWPEAVVAGGAARDWYLGNKISDIDIFICQEKSLTGDALKEKLENILEEEVVSLSGGKYEKPAFEGFETVRGGVKIQFLFHYKDLETTVAGFPINVSRIWWDGVDYRTHHTFSYYTNYGYVISTFGCPLNYEIKVVNKFPNSQTAIGIDGFLRKLGGVKVWEGFYNLPGGIGVLNGGF